MQKLENTLCAIGILWGGSNGHEWIPLTMDSGAGSDVFFRFQTEQVETAADLGRFNAHLTSLQ